MANTAIKTEEEKKEYFDTPEELNAKIEQLAEWVQQSEHFIAFTGAGVSTSAGIPDFRSGYNTVLPTGPGAWEKQALKKKAKKKQVRVSMASAVPTHTHMAFVKLMEEGILKYLISQNVDGLHRRSGIDPRLLAEVHGNTNLEKCIKCKKEYMRDFRVRTAQKVHSHETGRLCDDLNCRGKLKDTIINFGENLDEQILENGFEQSARADLCLAMGSSLRVTPAADMPKTTSKRGGNLVIVNLERTPLDHRAALCIHAFCDTVLNMLFEKLGLSIPEFKLIRRLKVTKRVGKKNREDVEELAFEGVDVDGCPYSLFPKIEAKKGGLSHSLTKEPMVISERRLTGTYLITVYFEGHYEEPALSFTLEPENLAFDTPIVYVMKFSHSTKTWDEPTIE